MIFSARILLWENTEVFGDFCLEVLIFPCMLISNGSVLYEAGCKSRDKGAQVAGCFGTDYAGIF